MRLLVTWLINAGALFALPYLMQSVRIDSYVTALFAALVLGLINTLIRPILAFIAFPVTVVTLGLFTLIINGMMFWLATELVRGMSVTGFWPAVGAAFLYSLISWGLSSLLLKK